MMRAVYALSIARLLLNKLSRDHSKRIVENYVSMNIISREDAENVIKFLEMLPEGEKKKAETLEYNDHVKLMILCAYMSGNVDFVKELSYHKSIADIVLTKSVEKTIGF